jgi:hypothetical protein
MNKIEVAVLIYLFLSVSTLNYSIQDKSENKLNIAKAFVVAFLWPILIILAILYFVFNWMKGFYK